MTRELYIENQRVDLPEDARFQLTFQIADFGELRPRGSGSNTIKLPKTPRNIAIFQNCNFVQVKSNFPYVPHSAYYYEDGWLIFRDATVYMLAITDKDFEIQCVWGNSNAIRELKALDMGDVAGLGNVNYGADAYGLIETGEERVLGEDIPMQLAVTPNGLLSEYTRGLQSIEKAIEALGVKINKRSIVFKSYLRNLYIFPAINSIKGETRKDGDCSFNGSIYNTLFNTDSDIIIRQNSGLASFQKSEVSIRDEWNARDVYFIPVFSGVNYIVKANLYIEYSEITEGVDNAIISAEVYSGKVILDSVKTEFVTIKNGGRYNLSFETKFKNGVRGLTLGIWPTKREQSNVPRLKFTGQVELIANDGNDYSVSIDMPQRDVNEIDGNLIRFADVFRGIKAFDFLKSCFENSGALMESRNGVIDLFTYNDIANNTAEMLDWSDKLVYIKEENVFNQDIGSKNFVKYKSSDNYNGYGDGFFENDLAVSLKKEDKDMVVNSNFTFNNGVLEVIHSDYGRFRPVYIPMFKKDAEGEIEFSGDGGLWLVSIYGIIDFPLISKDNNIVKGAKVNSVVTNQPTFNEIRSNCWTNYIGIQNAYRKARAIFNLRPSDIADFSFKSPIYLRQYAQSYIVTKVNYQRNASTVEMILIR